MAAARATLRSAVSWFLSKIYDSFMRKTEAACLAEWRRSLLAPLTGEVLEVGAGTGANLPHYGADVRRLVLSEPDRHMRGRLAERVGRMTSAPEIVSASVDALAFDSGSFDSVVSTLVLCSVPDLDGALAEIRRVLRPGGRLVFIEHVAADERPERLRWQERLEPFWVRMTSGCHLTRRSHLAMERAGFELADVRRESMRKALPIVRTSVRGIALRA
jgi:ubiquinone/menaquinone biosynthesis C-methylase UbiE